MPRGVGSTAIAKAKRPEDRYQELISSGKAVEEAVRVMREQGYNMNEIVAAAEMSVNKVSAILKGTSVRNNPGGRVGEKGDDGKDVYEPQTEYGKTLLKILETTAGINKAYVPEVVKLYETNPDLYGSPNVLMRTLMRSGLSWLRARDVADEFMIHVKPEMRDMAQMMGAQPMGIPGMHNPMYNPMMQSMYSPGMMYGQPTFYPPVPEDPEDKRYERKRQKRREEREEMMTDMMGMMFSMMPMFAMGGGRMGGPGMGPMGMGMGMPYNPFMEVVYEYQVGADGKPIKDEAGNLLMVARSRPAAAGYPHRDGKEDAAVTVLGNMAAAERQNTTTLMSKLVDVAGRGGRNDKFEDYLITHMESLESFDPAEYTVDLVTKLKDAGLFKQGPENMQIATMNMELKKWMHDQNQGLQKWIWEQKQVLADKAYARQQLKALTESVNKGITELGKPMVTSFAEGARAGKGGAPQPSSQAEQDVGKMSNEQLVETLQKVQQGEKVVEQAKAKVIAEVQKRGLQI